MPRAPDPRDKSTATFTDLVGNYQGVIDLLRRRSGGVGRDEKDLGECSQHVLSLAVLDEAQ